MALNIQINRYTNEQERVGHSGENGQNSRIWEVKQDSLLSYSKQSGPHRALTTKHNIGNLLTYGNNDRQNKYEGISVGMLRLS
jgi:hypothetical protein